MALGSVPNYHSEIKRSFQRRHYQNSTRLSVSYESARPVGTMHGVFGPKIIASRDWGSHIVCECTEFIRGRYGKIDCSHIFR